MTRIVRPVTLRTKLIIGIVAVIVAVCAVIGIVTELKLSEFLLAQKDIQLTAAQSRVFPPRSDHGRAAPNPDATEVAPVTCAAASATASPGQAPLPPWFLFRGVQSVGTLGAVVHAGTVADVGILTGAGTCAAVNAQAVQVLAALAPGAPPQSVTVPGHGPYRIAAQALPSGDVAVLGLPLGDVQNTLDRLTLTMIAVGCGGLIAAAGLVFVLVRRSLRPLERVAATARRVSTLRLDRGAVELGIRVPESATDPRTEAGQVGTALNQMLGHVSDALRARHASEQRVRQFVADASHELRTPLAAIRGYAELARRSEQDPDTVAHALRRVESESARMTALVDDLLLLARLDAGRPLDSAEVDLTMLAVDAVSDARAAGPNHHWRLELPEEPVTTTGDRARLYQVLANLLANARNHTPAGTTVVTALSATPAQVTLSVTDNGPGIPADQQAEVFGRFYRGDSSRSRAVASTGLGLAIVAAVVAAHGGRVELDSRPGSTTFRVLLGRGEGVTDRSSGGAEQAARNLAHAPGFASQTGPVRSKRTTVTANPDR